MLNLALEQIMSDHPITVNNSMSVGSVAHLLLRYRINGILVVDDNDKTKLTGVFTTTDLLRLVTQAFHLKDERDEALKRVAETPVSDVASKSVVSFQKEAEIGEVLEVMASKNIHTIPVFDGDSLVGVIGRHDVLNAALANH